MSEYMEFKNRAEFNAWHDGIKTELGLDGEGLIGVNAKTGLLAPTKQRTTAWCEPEVNMEDGYLIATVKGLSEAQAPAAERENDKYFDDRGYVSLDAEGNRVKPSENPTRTKPVKPPKVKPPKVKNRE